MLFWQYLINYQKYKKLNNLNHIDIFTVYILTPKEALKTFVTLKHLTANPRYRTSTTKDHPQHSDIRTIDYFNHCFAPISASRTHSQPGQIR